MLYERFEVLSSFVFLERVEIDTIRSSLEVQDVCNFEWMPVGRTAWHSQMKGRLLAEIGNSKLTSALLGAGFAKGDAEFLQLSIQNFQRISARIEYS